MIDIKVELPTKSYNLNSNSDSELIVYEEDEVIDDLNVNSKNNNIHLQPNKVLSDSNINQIS